MKASKKHFELFKEFGQKWLERFGLGDWEVNFQFDSLAGPMAHCAYCVAGKQATICLASDHEEPAAAFDTGYLNQTACHEVLHLVLSEMSAMAEDRVWDQACFDAVEHGVINRVLKSLGTFAVSP